MMSPLTSKYLFGSINISIPAFTAFITFSLRGSSLRLETPSQSDITNPSKPIEIAITAENDVVKCHTFNYVLPSDKKTEGIGLNNLQRRLSLLYGDNAILEVNRSSDTFTVDLRINVKN